MKLLSTLGFLGALVVSALAESHTISSTNDCGYGVPTIVVDGTIVSTDGYFSANGPVNGTAYLQDGSCAENGDGCATINFFLCNPDSDENCPTPAVNFNYGPPYTYHWCYTNGCGNECLGCTADPQCVVGSHGLAPYCPDAYNVNIAITWCG